MLLIKKSSGRRPWNRAPPLVLIVWGEMIHKQKCHQTAPVYMYTPLWLLRNLAIKEVNWYPFFYGNKRLEPLVCVRTPLTAILASETVLALICSSWVVHGILELPPTYNTSKANCLGAFLQKTYNVGQKNLGLGGKTPPSNCNIGLCY